MGDETLGFRLCSSTSRQRKSLESSFLESPRWASNSSVSGGDELKTSIVNSVPYSSNPQSLNEEKALERDSTAISPSFRSLLSLAESSAQWGTPSKQPFNLTPCSYPQVFCNPVSNFENHEPDQLQEDSSTNPDSSLIISTTNHQGSRVREASPNQSYRSTSSNEMLLDVERSISEEVENPKFESGSITQQRCGICKKLLTQKSPWCSYKTLRSGDMLTTGVFPCHHVYHVECLDKVIPTAQTRDPLCPICTNTIGAMEQPLIMPETLQMALRSLRRSRTAAETQTVTSPCNDIQTRHIDRKSHKWEKLSCCLNIRFTSSCRIPR